MSDLLVVALASAGIFALAALAQALSGFGASLVAVPLLAIVIDPVAAVVTATGVSLALATAAWRRERAHVDAPLSRRLTSAGVLGMPLGLVVLHLVSERILTVMIAAALAAVVVLLACRMRLPSGVRAQWGAGTLSGFLLTATGMNGPPLVICLQSAGLSPRAGRATLQAVFSAQDLVAMAAFVALGAMDPEIAMAMAAGWAGLPIGWVVGDALFHRLTPDGFRRVVLFGLSVSAVVCLGGAVLTG